MCLLPNGDRCRCLLLFKERSVQNKTPNPPRNDQILPISPLGRQLLKMGARGQIIGGSNVDLENIRTRGVRFVDSTKKGSK